VSFHQRRFRVFEEFKGALTEQYVLQELSSVKGIRSIYYWTSEATAEVEYVLWNIEKYIDLIMNEKTKKLFMDTGDAI
jgi:hypothetical protein